MVARLLAVMLALLGAGSVFGACIPSGTTDQPVYFVAVNPADFTTRVTGLSAFTVYRSRNGATAAAMTTPTISETDATNMPGVYDLLLDEDTTIDAGDDTQEMALHITATGMAPVTRTVSLCRSKITVGQTLTVSASGEADANAESWNGVAITTPLQTAADIRVEIDNNSTQLAKLGTPVGASIAEDIAALNDLDSTAVQAAANAALLANHLDHLMLTTYDPAAPPGSANSLFNQIVENDLGGARFTANALEQAPGGAGGSADWTAGERDEIRGRLGITGTTAVGGNIPTLALQSSIAALPTDADIKTQVDQGLLDYDAPTRAELTSDIAGLNDLDAAGVRLAIGLTAPNLDTQLAALPTATEIRDAILTATIDGTINLRCSFALLLSYAVGPRTSVSSTHVWRDVTDTVDRIVGTTADANRSLTSLVCP